MTTNKPKLSIYKKTNDEQYAHTISNGEFVVKAEFNQTGPNPPEAGNWIIYVTGINGYTMEMEFINEWYARTVYLTIVEREFVNQLDLETLGFYRV